MNNSFNINGTDGVALRVQSWLPDNPELIVLIVHGIGEHSDRYTDVAQFFNNKNYGVYGFDLRGHGKSEGKRGHSPSYNQLMDDIEQILMSIRVKHNNTPIFIYGHSLGGNLVTNFILKKSVNELSGAIISAPWLKAAFEPPKLKVMLGKIMASIYPSLTQGTELKTKNLSRDPEVETKYLADALVHDQMSAALFVGGSAAAQWALDHAAELKLPSLIMHGTEDKITSVEGSKEFAGKSPIVELKIWDGLFHELHNEPEKEDVLNFASDWINRQIAPKSL